jgi:hypothetical protein
MEDQKKIQGALEALPTGSFNEVRVSTVPQWIHLVGFAAFFFIGTGLRVFVKHGMTPQQEAALTQHSAMLAGIFILIPCLILAPVLLVNWSARTWLRRYYPDSVAVRWNGWGFDFVNQGFVPWTDLKSIKSDIFGKRNGRKMTFSIKPVAQMQGVEEIQIPLMLIRDLQATQSRLKADCDTHGVSYFPDPTLASPASSRWSITVSFLVIATSVFVLNRFGPGIKDGLVLALMMSFLLTFMLHLAGGVVWRKLKVGPTLRNVRTAQRETEALRLRYEAAKKSGDPALESRTRQAYFSSVDALSSAVAPLKAVTDADMAAIASRSDFGRNIRAFAWYAPPTTALTMYPWIDNIGAVLAVVGALFGGMVLLGVSSAFAVKRLKKLAVA